MPQHLVIASAMAATVLTATLARGAECEFLDDMSGGGYITMRIDDSCVIGPLRLWEEPVGGVFPGIPVNKADDIQVIQQPEIGVANGIPGGRLEFRPEGIGRDNFRIRVTGRGRSGDTVTLTGTISVTVRP